MQKISYDTKCLSNWVTPEKLESYSEPATEAEAMLREKKGLGNDFLGWLNLPAETDEPFLTSIKKKADEIRENTDIFISIGIGGSYLGAKAAIEFLSPSFEGLRKPHIIFAGHQVNSDYMSDLLNLIENKDVTLNVISKSGTTTEPGIAFRVLRKWMEKKYGRKEAAKRIIATTDPQKGALRKLAEEEGYATFSIPPDVGGRYSVLTPVGLLPIAVSGIDLFKLLSGAKEAIEFCSGNDITQNISMHYAIARNILFRQGKAIEVLAGFQPQLHYIGEWWKQLTGESEGKNFTGIFPAAVDYTTDLHSLGQWMQEGTRNVFETFMILKKTESTVTIPGFDDNSDGLNYLKDSSFEIVNNSAYKGTVLAHLDGGVPISTITIEDRTPEALGQLFYFFEKAIALSGHLLRVNPFNQPGVEAYKKNMFAFLSKPGFEEKGEELKSKIKDLDLNI